MRASDERQHLADEEQQRVDIRVAGDRAEEEQRGWLARAVAWREVARIDAVRYDVDQSVGEGSADRHGVPR